LLYTFTFNASTYHIKPFPIKSNISEEVPQKGASLMPMGEMAAMMAGRGVKGLESACYISRKTGTS
jgi:hypothetical protein